VQEETLGDAVHFTGAVPPATLADYMAAADVFCLASSREGWPNVVHEALGCGTPVVVTDIGGVREMVGCEEHGLIVPPGDAPLLAAGLRRALGREWNRGRIAAWGAARSWNQVGAETAEVLREAAGANGKAAWQS
jgi:glycosyltransferase involved in cell wall biosynthesis